jgi:hypothetical protein
MSDEKQTEAERQRDAIELRHLRKFFAMFQSYADPTSDHYKGSQVAHPFVRAAMRASLVHGSSEDKLGYHPAMHPFTAMGMRAFTIGMGLLFEETQMREMVRKAQGGGP